jgi:dTDP-4-dehydrorhamnose 3,5-epimerase
MEEQDLTPSRRKVETSLQRFKVIKTPLSGLVVLERLVLQDKRGSFCRLYESDELSEVFSKKPIVQINHSISKIKGTVRGLHFQHPPFAEAKLVSCIRGEIFDVAVDLRSNSSTFLSWYGEYLSESNSKSLAIPKGFAHGFQTMTDECELLYFHDAMYNPKAEGGLNIKDPRLGIRWPLSISTMSERDEKFPIIDDTYKGIIL